MRGKRERYSCSAGLASNSNIDIHATLPIVAGSPVKIFGWRCASVLREEPIELVLGTAIVSRDYSRALLLAPIAPLQPLGQFLGRLAFQRVPHQGAQLGACGAFVILGLDNGRSSSPAGGGRSPGRQ